MQFPTCACLLLVMAGCSSSVESLASRGTDREGAGPRSDAGLAPADAGAAEGGDPACVQDGDALAARDLREIHRIGLNLSDTVVEGEFGAPEPASTGMRARLRIHTVWRGPKFMEGTDVWVHFDETELAAVGLPGRFVVGFDGNRYPLYGDDGEPVWWTKLVVTPATERAGLEAAAGYRASEFVAVARIERQDAERTHFRIVQSIAGALPPVVSVNWGRRTFAAPFPPVSEQDYIATFAHVTQDASSGVNLGTLLDLRPLTANSEALVRAALGAPPAFDSGELLRIAAEYRQSWTFRLATDVVATTVDGLASECCTGAGGTYVGHRITTSLRGDTRRAQLTIGGHAYYSEESCGDSFILALDGLADVPEPRPGPLSCEPFAEGWNTDLPVAQVVGRVDDTPALRSDVRRWLDSAPPVYRMSTEAPQSPGSQSAAGLWSSALGPQCALATARLALIDIVDVKPLAVGYEVSFETTFASSRPDHLPVHRVNLSFRCGDARLLRVGARWIAPIVFSEPAPWNAPDLDVSRAFIVPGLLLPPTRYVLRIAETFQRSLHN